MRKGGENLTGTAENRAYAASSAGGAYCIQGNCIDRADTAGCNGRGWTEDVSYTLNTIDRPAVAYKTVIVSEPPPPLLIFKPGAVSRLGGNVWSDGIAPTLTAEFSDNIPALCLENHPQDSRVDYAKDNVVQTLSAKMGTGGGNVPLIMERKNNTE